MMQIRMMRTGGRHGAHAMERPRPRCQDLRPRSETAKPAARQILERPVACRGRAAPRCRKQCLAKMRNKGYIILLNGRQLACDRRGEERRRAQAEGFGLQPHGRVGTGEKFFHFFRPQPIEKSQFQKLKESENKQKKAISLSSACFLFSPISPSGCDAGAPDGPPRRDAPERVSPRELFASLGEIPAGSRMAAVGSWRRGRS